MGGAAPAAAEESDGGEEDPEKAMIAKLLGSM
jgi:hypothetical protein